MTEEGKHWVIRPVSAASTTPTTSKTQPTLNVAAKCARPNNEQKVVTPEKAQVGETTGVSSVGDRDNTHQSVIKSIVVAPAVGIVGLLNESNTATQLTSSTSKETQKMLLSRASTLQGYGSAAEKSNTRLHHFQQSIQKTSYDLQQRSSTGHQIQAMPPWMQNKYSGSTLGQSNGWNTATSTGQEVEVIRLSQEGYASSATANSGTYPHDFQLLIQRTSQNLQQQRYIKGHQMQAASPWMRNKYYAPLRGAYPNYYQQSLNMGSFCDQHWNPQYCEHPGNEMPQLQHGYMDQSTAKQRNASSGESFPFLDNNGRFLSCLRENQMSRMSQKIAIKA